MDSDKKIQWKNPYEQKIRPAQLVNLFDRTDQYYFSYNSWLRLFVEGKQRTQCSFTEMELIKYLTHKKVYTNTRPFWIMSGIFFTLQIRDKLADIKAGPYYYPSLLNIWYRHALFQYSKAEQTRSGLYIPVFEQREMNKQLQVEDWRLQSLKQEQINNYRKKRDDLMDFLNIGEDENFNLL